MQIDRVYITGDTHGSISIRKLSSKNFKPFCTVKDNVLFITGDAGIIWNCDPDNKEELYWLDWLEAKPWITVYCDGNHENFARLFGGEFPIVEIFGGRAYKIRDNIYALKRGEVFTINGNTYFVFGGAKSHDTDHRGPKIPESIGKWWWPEEIPSQEDYDNAMKNLARHNFSVDYVISHTCPLHEVLIFMPSVFMKPGYGADKTEWMLQDFKDVLTFKHWFFGHMHVDQSATRFSCLFNGIYEIPEDSDSEKLNNFIYHCRVPHPMDIPLGNDDEESDTSEYIKDDDYDFGITAKNQQLY